MAKQSTRNQKTVDVRYEETNKTLYRYSRVVFNAISHTEYFPSSEKIPLTSDNFAGCLSDQELEDLVGLFLQERYDYIFYPSSCKTATKDFEYIMLDKKSKKLVYTQVKQNAIIHVKHYSEKENYKNCEVYLFSNLGYNGVEFKPDNVHLLDKRELFDYFKENIELFQKRLKFDFMVYSLPN